MRNSTTYKLSGTKTFRRSSSKILGRWGGNLQNIEKSMRQVYKPDGFTPDLTAKCSYWMDTGDTSVFTEEELVTLRVFIQTDQSGAEALIVAYDCENKDYRQLFIHGVKPHVYVALKLFIDIWKKKAVEHNLMIKPDVIDKIASSKIHELKNFPEWRDLDRLIKDSDNWSLSERYYYLAKQTCHCVDKETEVLTRDGWKSIAETNGEQIMITNGDISWFESPTNMNVFDYSGNMYYFSGEEVNQYITPEHKMVYVSNDKQHVDIASNVYKLSRVNIPTAVMYEGGSVELPDWKIKLLVAIQADAYIEPSGNLSFKFAKDRKIDRLREILREGNINYSFYEHVDTTTAGNIVSRFSFRCDELVQYFAKSKVWDSWLLTFSHSNLCTLINELKYWDGSSTSQYQHKREEYYSAIPQNISWIKTICHLIRKQGTISTDGVKLGINRRVKSIASHKSIHNFIGKVYCPTVSTGMFLIRRHGKISITHNSANYDIQPPTFRMNLLEKSGGKVNLPLKDSEYFLMTYRALFPEIPERNRRVQRQVEDTGIIYNMFGFPYVITNYNLQENNMKEYFAWLPQSTVGEITRKAIINFNTFVEEEANDCDILADTHDSFLVQCPLFMASAVKNKMQECMNQELTSPIDGVKFNMKSEANIGFNWNSYKKDKNILGLKELSWM